MAGPSTQSRSELSHSELAAHDPLQLAAALAVVVDDPVGELVLGGQLLGGDREAGVDRLRAVGAAGLEPPAQRRRARAGR